MMVIEAELEGGGFSVAIVGESPISSSAKTMARSEAKHRKRSFFIVRYTIPQSPLDNHNPKIYNLPMSPRAGLQDCRLVSLSAMSPPVILSSERRFY